MEHQAQMSSAMGTISVRRGFLVAVRMFRIWREGASSVAFDAVAAAELGRTKFLLTPDVRPKVRAQGPLIGVLPRFSRADVDEGADLGSRAELSRICSVTSHIGVLANAGDGNDGYSSRTPSVDRRVGQRSTAKHSLPTRDAGSDRRRTCGPRRGYRRGTRL